MTKTSATAASATVSVKRLVEALRESPTMNSAQATPARISSGRSNHTKDVITISLRLRHRRRLCLRRRDRLDRPADGLEHQVRLHAQQHDREGDRRQDQNLPRVQI